jgi:hypothetical protein
LTSRKKPGVAFWATVVVVTLLVYPLSVGPSCWISSRWGRWGNGTVVSKVYEPLANVAFADDDGLLAKIFHWYSMLLADSRYEWVPVIGPREEEHWLWIDSEHNGPL